MNETHTMPALHYLNNGHGLKSWLLTKDHKRIAILYLISISIFFFLGGLMGVLIRLELATPQGDLLGTDAYNKAFTLHGVIMIRTWKTHTPAEAITTARTVLPSPSPGKNSPSSSS